MDVFDAIKNRKSIRKYSNKPIEKEKIDKVLEAGRLAPSAKNRQEWKFILVQNKELIEKLSVAALYNRAFVAEAPAILAAVATEQDYVMKCGQHAYTVDLSIAMSFMILEAEELGLGTCWLGSFDEEQFKKVLNIPDGMRVVAITPIGYPAEDPAPKPRKPIEEVISYDGF